MQRIDLHRFYCKLESPNQTTQQGQRFRWSEANQWKRSMVSRVLTENSRRIGSMVVLLGKWSWSCMDFPMRSPHCEFDTSLQWFLSSVDSFLQFEWAWQNPESSVRLKHLNLPKTKKRSLNFKLKILAEMLRVGPWMRLPLTIRWLTDKKQALDPMPPFHMPITSGSINVSKQTNTIPSKRKKVAKQEMVISSEDPKSLSQCSLCHHLIQVGRTHKTPIRIHSRRSRWKKWKNYHRKSSGRNDTEKEKETCFVRMQIVCLIRSTDKGSPVPLPSLILLGERRGLKKSSCHVEDFILDHIISDLSWSCLRTFSSYRENPIREDDLT